MDNPSPVDRFLGQLQRVRPKSGGGWTSRCPGHEDTNNSLSIDVKDDKVLLKCFAGCPAETVVRSLGMQLSDLFATDNGSSKPDARRIVARYDYTDAHGALVYQVVRFEPKDFRQRRPDGNGGWTWNLNGTKRVPFGLDTLQNVDAVLAVEGEKDVLALRALGLPATTNAGGAGKWTAELTQHLVAAGVKRVRIIPDNDDTGRAHAETVAQSCHRAGLDARIVSLPGLPSKGDVSDFLKGHSKADLVALIQAAEPYAPPRDVPEVCGLALTPIGDLLAEPDEEYRWIVRDRIPMGGVVLLASKPKAGKSTLARDLSFSVSIGRRWLGWETTAGPVWYVALEEKRSELRKHFRALGATSTAPLRLFIDRAPDNLLEQLHTAAAKERPVLIVIDTLQRLIRCRDMNDYAEVTGRMEPLLSLARQTGAALLLVHHAGKSARAGIDAILGSTALAGSVDNVMVLNRLEQQRTLTTIQRIGDDLDETILALDKETQRVSLGLPRQEAEVADVMTAIESLLKAGGELTEREIGGHVEGRTEAKRAALRKLLGTDRVARSGTGRRGDAFKYRLAGTVLMPSAVLPSVDDFTSEGFVEVA